jgi:hypothetical protein
MTSDYPLHGLMRLYSQGDRNAVDAEALQCATDPVQPG